MKKTLQLPIILLTLMMILSSCVNKKSNTSVDLEANQNEMSTYNAEPGLYKIDPENSSIEWLGKKPTGSHNGDIQLKQSSIQIDKNGTISGGMFIFDMQTINCTDLEGQPKTNIEGHLKNADFFDVEKFPEASFVIEKSNDTTMSGVLTIKNNSHPIKFNYTRTGTLEFKAEFKIDRTLYDIRYGSKSFFSDLGDKFIDDEVEIKLNPITFK